MVQEPHVAPGIQHHGRVVMWATWPQTVLGIMVILLRCIFAGTKNGRWRWDCYWAVFALCLSVTAQIFLTLGCIEGIGEHIWDLSSLTQAGYAIRWYWISALTCIWAVTFAKVAIVSLLLSVWCPWQTKRRIFLHVVWISNVIWTAVQTYLTFSQCNPRERIWNYGITTGDCNLRPLALNWGYFIGAWSVMTDIVLALYPILIMRDIKADRKTKIGFCLLMSGGFISAIASVMRTWYLYKMTLNFDTTHDSLASTICGSSELWLILILSSIPPLKPFFLRILNRKDNSQFGDTIPSGSTGETIERKVSQAPRLDELDLRQVSSDEMAMAERGLSQKKNWMGGITMRSSVWMTSRPSTRPQTRNGTT
ncbi:hypothetical protein C1H76_3287 [Elsinoe australis]|uniref:Rhodopsin domain-containing protein n=1 Tax=Elsinoe australis TaxID=40998 RepID=A0A4U7B0M4_9PEZI|nr:hypothetical protein C1H76_3287 [Elsinoe australis]